MRATPKPRRTKPDGSCAFHAALGKWNAHTLQFEVDNIHAIRRRMADFIRHSQSTLASDFVIAAMKELVMNNHIAGEKFRQLRRDYEAYHVVDKGITQSKQSYLEAELQKQPHIITKIKAYIEPYIQERYREDKNYTAKHEADLRSHLYKQYLTYIDKHSDLNELIAAGPPELVEAHRRMHERNPEINWDALSNDVDFLEEYANFISQPSQWLLPCEIGIIAYAFNIGIDFHNIFARIEVENYNPECTERVLVYYNGADHYERMTLEDSSYQFIDKLQVKNDALRKERERTLKQERQKIDAIAATMTSPLSLDKREENKETEKRLQQILSGLREDQARLTNTSQACVANHADLKGHCEALENKVTLDALRADGRKKGAAKKVAGNISEKQIQLDDLRLTAAKFDKTRRAVIAENNANKKLLDEKTKEIAEKKCVITDAEKNIKSCNGAIETFKKKGLNLDAEIAAHQQSLAQLQQDYEHDRAEKSKIIVELSSCAGPRDVNDRAYIKINGEKIEIKKSAAEVSTTGRETLRGIAYVWMNSETGEIDSECFDTFTLPDRAVDLAKKINENSKTDNMIHMLISADESTNFNGEAFHYFTNDPDSVGFKINTSKQRAQLVESLSGIGSTRWDDEVRYRNPWYFLKFPGPKGYAKERRLPCAKNEEELVISKTPKKYVSETPSAYLLQAITAAYSPKIAELEKKIIDLQHTTSIKTALEEEENVIEKNKKEIHVAQDSIQYTEKEITDIKEAMDRAVKQIDNEELRCTQVNAKITTLEKEICDDAGKSGETLACVVSEYSTEQFNDKLKQLEEKLTYHQNNLRATPADATNRAKKSEIENVVSHFEKKLTECRAAFEKQRVQLNASGTITIKLSSCSGPGGTHTPETSPAFIESTTLDGAQQRIIFKTLEINTYRQRGIYYACIDSRNGKVVFNECFDTHGYFQRAKHLADAINAHSDKEYLIHALVSVDESMHLSQTPKEKEWEVRDPLMAALAKIGSHAWGNVGNRDRWYFISGPGIEPSEKIAPYFEDKDHPGLTDEKNPPLTAEFTSDIPNSQIKIKFESEKKALEENYKALASEFEPIEKSMLDFTKLSDIKKNLEATQAKLKAVQAVLANADVADAPNEIIKQKERQRILAAELACIEDEKKECLKLKHQLFEINALTDNIVARTYAWNESTPAEQFAVLLLQAIAPNIKPDDYRQRVDVLLQNLSCKDKNRLNSDDYRAILAVVNQEFTCDDIASLTITLHQNADSVGTDSVIPIGKKTDRTREVIIHHRDDRYFLMTPAAAYYNNNQTLHAANLFMRMMLEGEILQSLCQHQARCLSKVDIQAAYPEALLSAQQAGIDAIRKDKGFADCYNRLFKNNSVHDDVATASKVIARMSEFEKTIPIDVAEKYFHSFKNDFVEKYKAIIQAEFISRFDKEERLSENAAIKKCRETMAETTADINNLNHAIDVQLKKCAGEETAVTKTIEQSRSLQRCYEEQVSEIKTQISALEEKCTERKTTVDALKQNVHTKIEKITVIEEHIEADQGSKKLLQAEEKKLIQKRDSVVNELLALEKRQLDIRCDIAKANIEQTTAKSALEIASKKKKRIDLLLTFIENVQHIMKKNDSLFTDRRDALREKIKSLESSPKKSFGELYDYLIAQPEFKQLESPDIKDIMGDADIYVDDCLAAMKEVVQDATVKFDLDPETSKFTMIFKGYNISWKDCFQKLVTHIKNQLALIGLSLNSNNQLIVVNAQLIPVLSKFPLSHQLKEIIAEKMRTQNEPDPYQVKSDMPTWSGENDPEKIKQCIESASIEFKDIVSAFVEGIEICAGNNLHVEEDITLPGVDLTLFAQEEIFLKKNCNIETSGRDAFSYQYKARDGEAGHAIPDGRDGDDGLCGYAGQTAGDIFLSAKKPIDNIDTLHCIANGGKGEDGQVGGQGEKGKQGRDSDPAKPDHPDEIDKYKWYKHENNLGLTTLAIAEEPEASGDGGVGGAKGWDGGRGLAGRVVVDNAGEILKKDDKRITEKNGSAGRDPRQIPGALGGPPGSAGYRGMSRFYYREWRQKIIKTFFGPIIPQGIGEWNEEQTRPDYYDIEKFKDEFQGRYREHGATKNYAKQYSVHYAIDKFDTVDKEAYRGTHLGKNRAIESERSTCMAAESRRCIAKKRAEKIHSQHNRQALQQKSDHAATLTAVKKAKKRCASELNQWSDAITASQNTIAACAQTCVEKADQLQSVTAAIQKQTTEKDNIAQAIVTIAKQIETLDKKINDSKDTSHVAHAQLLDVKDTLHKSALDKLSADIDLTVEQDISIQFAHIYHDLEKQLQAQKEVAQQLLKESGADTDALQSQLDVLIEKLDALRETLQSLLNQERAHQKRMKELEAARMTSQQMTTEETTVTQQHEVKVDVDAKSVVVQSKIKQLMSMRIPDLTHETIIKIDLETLIALSQEIAQHPDKLPLFIQCNRAWLRQNKKISISDMSCYWSMLFNVANADGIHACVMEAHNTFLEIIMGYLGDSSSHEMTKQRNQYHQLFYLDDKSRTVSTFDDIRFRKHCFLQVMAISNTDWTDAVRASVLLEMPTVYDYPINEADDLKLLIAKVHRALLGETAETNLDKRFFEIHCYVVRKRNERRLHEHKPTEKNSDEKYFQHIQTQLKKINSDYSKKPLTAAHIIVRLHRLLLNEYQSLLPNNIADRVKPLENNLPEFAKALIALIRESQPLCDDPIAMTQTILSAVQLTTAQCIEIVREINKTTLTEADHLLQHLMIHAIDALTLDKGDCTDNALTFIRSISAIHKISADVYVESLRLKTLQSLVNAHKKLCESDPVFQRTIAMVSNAGYGLTIEKQLQQIKSLYVLIQESEKFNAKNELSTKLPIYCDNLLTDIRVSFMQSSQDYCESLNRLTVTDTAKDVLKSRLHQLLFLIQHGELQKMNLPHLEEWSNRCKNDLSTCADKDQAAIWYDALYQIDAQLNQHLMMTLQKNMTDQSAQLSTEKTQHDNLEKHLPLFHQFIRNGEEPAVRERKKQFVQLLLKKVLAHKKSIDGIQNISDLIRAHNDAGLAQLKNKALFSDAIYQKLPKTEHAALCMLADKIKNNDVNTIFEAWKPLMQYGADQMMAHKSDPDPVILHFFAESFELLRHVIFEDHEQQSALNQWQKEIRTPLSKWYFEATEKKEVEKTILQIESFGDYLQASAYQDDLLCHVQRLVKDYETSNITYQQKDALRAVNTTALPMIANSFQMLAVKIPAEISRVQLTSELSTLFSSDALMHHPEQWLTAITEKCDKTHQQATTFYEQYCATLPKPDESAESNDALKQSIRLNNEQAWVLLLDKKDKKIAEAALKDVDPDDRLSALRAAYWNEIIIKQLFLPLKAEFVASTDKEFQKTLTDFLTNDNIKCAEEELKQLKGQESQHTDLLNRIYACQSELCATFSIATGQRDQNGWLFLVDTLVHCEINPKEKLTLTHQILKLSHYCSSFSDLARVVFASSEKNVMHLVLCHVLENAIDRQVFTDNHDTLQSISVLRSEGMNTERGREFIELFAKEIYKGLGPHKPSLSVTRFNHLLTLLISVKAYDDNALIADFKTRPIQYWESVLTRRALAIQLKIPSSDQKGRELIEKISRLQKQYNPDVINPWIEKLAENNTALDTTKLLTVFTHFVSKAWTFDKAAFDEIKDKNANEWLPILSVHFLKKKQSVERTPQVIAKDMRDENEDPLVLDLIQGDKSKLEDLIEKITKNTAYASLTTEDEIKKSIQQFKTDHPCGTVDFLKNGGTDEELIAFLALMMKAVKIVEDKTIYNTQLTALICYIKGFDTKSFLGNISTGEGKALIARMLAITGAMRGERVDFVTSSQALAIPQANDSIKLVELFGFKVCNICDEQCNNSEDERKRRYENNQIFYGDLASFQRDLLLTEYFDKGIRPKQSDRLIVDEVDSMCIDNADKVLYISHAIHDFSHFRMLMSFIWLSVNTAETKLETALNIKNIKQLCIDKMDSAEVPFPKQLREFILDKRLNLWIKNAYLAKRMTIDREYSVPSTGEHANTVVINDLPTGVEQMHSQWSNGLHQFLQLKESKALADESLRAIFISNMSYFNRYQSGGRLNGMSGSLGKKGGKERELLKDIYGADIFTLPRLRTERVVVEEADIQGNDEEWKKSVAKDVNEKIDAGRAVLIICEDKNAVKAFKERLEADLKSKGKKFKIHIYDSLTGASEYSVRDLQQGDIVIATNIAGRGTDLKIKKGSALEEAGGLHVISTYMYSNERTEIQADGRTGRDGQEGTTKFCVCDSRHSKSTPISIEQLRDERDQAEIRRLYDISQVKKPRLDAEQGLLNKFYALQKNVIAFLKENAPSYVIALQVKSLQNHWTMWLENNNKLLDDTHKTVTTKHEALFNAFEQFETDMMAQLDRDEERLVDEPEELCQLGKCLMAHGNPAGAINCFDKAIKENPDFAAFPHYYKGQAILQNSDNKSAAANELRLAVHGFEVMQERLEAANEDVLMVNTIKRESGDGLPVDMFTKTNVDESVAIQYHIDAAKSAIGSTLSSKHLQGTLAANDSKIVFEELLDNVPQMKNSRVSRKTTIGKDDKNNDAFCYDGKAIKLPEKFNDCKEALFDLFKQRVGEEKPHKERRLLPADLGNIMLTASEMIQRLDAHLLPLKIITQHKSIMSNIHSNSFWQRAEFQGKGFDIKSLLTTAKMSEPSDKVEAWIAAKIPGVTDWHKIIDLLKDNNILSEQDGYAFKPDAIDKIKAYVKTAEASKNNLHQPENLNYEARHHFHHRTLEKLILSLADKPHFVKSDIDLPENNEDAARYLWAFLEKNQLVRNPGVDFTQCSDSETKIKNELDAIYHGVHSKIWNVINDIKIAGFELTPDQNDAQKKSNDHSIPLTEKEKMHLSDIDRRNDRVKKLTDAINEILKKSIGSLHTLHKVELKNLQLHDFYEGEKLPPIVLLYAQRACADVLNLIEKVDKDKARREALIVALIGVAQIIAGVMIAACCPELSRILISEGIGDISFAVQSYISGTFSWSTYREHKIQSLAISIMAAGVSSALKSTPLKAAEIAKEATKEVAKSVTQTMTESVIKELTKAALTVAVNTGTSLAMSTIAEKITRALLEDFKRDFKDNVKTHANEHFSEIKNTLTQLYQKVGKDRANVIFDDIIKNDELNILKSTQENIKSVAIGITRRVSGAIAGLSREKQVVVDPENSMLNGAIDLADFVRKCSEVADYANQLNNIATTSADFFEKLSALLKAKLNSVKAETNLPVQNDSDIQKDVERKFNSATDLMLTQFEKQVEQLFTQVGTRVFNYATEGLMKSAHAKIDKAIEAFYKEPVIEKSVKETQAAVMASSKDNEAYVKQDWENTPGLSLQLDALDDTAKQAIYAGDGDVFSADEVRQLSGEQSPEVVVKDEKVYYKDKVAFCKNARSPRADGPSISAAAGDAPGVSTESAQQKEKVSKPSECAHKEKNIKRGVKNQHDTDTGRKTDSVDKKIEASRRKGNMRHTSKYEGTFFSNDWDRHPQSYSFIDPVQTGSAGQWGLELQTDFSRGAKLGFEGPQLKGSMGGYSSVKLIYFQGERSEIASTAHAAAEAKFSVGRGKTGMFEFEAGYLLGGDLSASQLQLPETRTGKFCVGSVCAEGIQNVTLHTGSVGGYIGTGVIYKNGRFNMWVQNGAMAGSGVNHKINLEFSLRAPNSKPSFFEQRAENNVQRHIQSAEIERNSSSPLKYARTADSYEKAAYARLFSKVTWHESETPQNKAPTQSGP